MVVSKTIDYGQSRMRTCNRVSIVHVDVEMPCGKHSGLSLHARVGVGVGKWIHKMILDIEKRMGPGANSISRHSNVILHFPL